MRMPTLLLATMVALGGTAHAQNKCQSAKLTHAVKKAVCLAVLDAKRIKTGKPIDPVKVVKCETKFATAYAKLERKGGCNTIGDAGFIEDRADTFVSDLVSALDRDNPAPNCPGAPCASFGQNCSVDGDCCSNDCEETGNPDFCGIAIDVPGGCCQTSGDCAFGAPCVGGRCQCVLNGGACSISSNCCSNDCSIGTLTCQ